MTQVAALFVNPQRDEHGITIIRDSLGRVMSGKELHRYRLFLLGIRDPETVEALWKEEVAKQKDLAAQFKKGRRR